jgi:thiol-disulfide isomerase/thioredoxin
VAQLGATLGPAELRGQVVLLDFWTLTCINWLRTEPYVRAWSQAYRDDGLVVIGVHTPEFSFEQDIDRVRQATKERGIDYPVAADNGYAIWRGFDNHFWPALYFVDAEGVIRDQQFGEGRYEQSERVIQRLLGVERELVSVEGFGVEAEADWDHLRTPETYLGYERTEHFALPVGAAFDERRSYQLPERLGLNQWALATRHRRWARTGGRPATKTVASATAATETEGNPDVWRLEPSHRLMWGASTRCQVGPANTGGLAMRDDARNGRLRLKQRALELGAHLECLGGRDQACQSCRDIMDRLIDPGGRRTVGPVCTSGGSARAPRRSR